MAIGGRSDQLELCLDPGGIRFRDNKERELLMTAAIWGLQGPESPSPS